MNPRSFLNLTGAIFSVISILHGLRALFSWKAVIGSWTVPVWLSWAAFALAGYLSFTAFQLKKRI